MIDPRSLALPLPASARIPPGLRRDESIGEILAAAFTAERWPALRDAAVQLAFVPPAGMAAALARLPFSDADVRQAAMRLARMDHAAAWAEVGPLVGAPPPLGLRGDACSVLIQDCHQALPLLMLFLYVFFRDWDKVAEIALGALKQCLGPCDQSVRQTPWKDSIPPPDSPGETIDKKQANPLGFDSMELQTRLPKREWPAATKRKKDLNCCCWGKHGSPDSDWSKIEVKCLDFDRDTYEECQKLVKEYPAAYKDVENYCKK